MCTTDVLSLWVVEWSEQQQQFHVDTVDAMLQNNLNSFYHRASAGYSDWIVVGFASTFEQASDNIQQLKARLDRPDAG